GGGGDRGESGGMLGMGFGGGSHGGGGSFMFTNGHFLASIFLCNKFVIGVHDMGKMIEGDDGWVGLNDIWICFYFLGFGDDDDDVVVVV
ncbi:hypothetical protein Tco_0401999, partial [Tanacetum coccineum]